MALLSVGIIGIQRAMQQAILTRGQARDYTEARFLLEEAMATVELQPILHSGKGPTGHSDDGGEDGRPRFEWKTEVTRIDLPEPELPADMPEDQRREFKLSARYLAKITATVTWTRRGEHYEETFETLWSPEKLYVPEEEL